MKRLAFSLFAFGILVFGCAAGPAHRRPRVDISAMREAMASSQRNEPLASPAAYAHFLASRLAHEDGDHRNSADELRLALATDEGSALLHTRLAEEFQHMGDLAHAEGELKKVLEHDTRDASAQLLMGKILLAGHRFSRARLHLRQAIQLAPRDPDAYLTLAQLHLEQSSPDEALAVVEELAQALPGEPSGYKRLGLSFLDREDLPRAQLMLERALDRDPGDFEVWAMLAQIYQAQGRLERAEAAFDKALELDPDSRDVLLWAGKLSLQQGSPVRARAYFDRLLSFADNADWTLKIASAYLSAQRLSEASEVLEQARSVAPGPKLSFSTGLVRERLRRFVQAADAYGEVPPDADLFPEARLRRALCLSQAGLHAKALELFEQAKQERPDQLSLYVPYAAALERAGLPTEALALLEKARKDAPVPEILDALDTLYERLGRGPEGLSLLQRAVAERPRDEELLYALGAAYERRGELERAMQQMRAVLGLNPKNAAALNFIGYTLADKGTNLDEAEKLIRRALELQPDSGAFLDSLGWLDFRKGDVFRAVIHLEKAVSLLPDDPLVREHLGDAYARAGRKKDAVDAYRRALEDAQRRQATDKEFEILRQGLLRKLKLLSSDAADR